MRILAEHLDLLKSLDSVRRVCVLYDNNLPVLRETLQIAVELFLQISAAQVIFFPIWLTIGTGAIIKLIIARERPLTEYAANLALATHSFPSGHTSGSTVAYGLLAYLAWQLIPQPLGSIVVIALIVLIIFIGISRVYLGAHFPSDIVGGWLLGAIVLCGIIVIVRPSI